MSRVAKDLRAAFDAFDADLRAGRVKSFDVIALVLDDAERLDDLPTCPECSARPVRGDRAGKGVCEVCWLRRVRDRHQEIVGRLTVITEVNAAKQAAHRLRVELGDDCPADLRGRTDRREDRICPACEQPFRVAKYAAPDALCITCRARAHRRANKRQTAAAGGTDD